MSSIEEKAKKIIEENLYMTIATASKEATPWISPVVFGTDDDYNFYWTSAPNATHSQYLEENNTVALVIFNSTALWETGEAVYVTATARQLDREGLEKAITSIYINKWSKFPNPDISMPLPDASTFLVPSANRMYCATPTHMYLLANETKVKKNGQIIDNRAEVSLSKK